MAVLPIENLGDSLSGYFADGMTDEVRGKLAQLQGLTVIARSSSNEYRGTSKSAQDSARDLGAKSHAKAEGCRGEVPRYAVAHERDLCRAKGESCNLLSRTAAIVALVDHVDNFVGSWVHDADLVLHHHVAVVAVIGEERDDLARYREEADVPWHPVADMTVKSCIGDPSPPVIKRRVQTLTLIGA